MALQNFSFYHHPTLPARRLERIFCPFFYSKAFFIAIRTETRFRVARSETKKSVKIVFGCGQHKSRVFRAMNLWLPVWHHLRSHFRKSLPKIYYVYTCNDFLHFPLGKSGWEFGSHGNSCLDLLRKYWLKTSNGEQLKLDSATHPAISASAEPSTSAERRRYPHRALSASPACHFPSPSAWNFLHQRERLKLILIDIILIVLRNFAERTKKCLIKFWC